ncbi:MAG: thioredoxin family protein [Phaeodactylibacter sp.]|nr:thioredoxin family protein [Phaeodactylibacter sp.]
MKNHLQYLLMVCYLTVVAGCSSGRALSKASNGPVEITFEALESRMAERPRPVAVFLHTDWCRFCQNMKQTTFRDDKVLSLLSDAFYFIAFDAEQRAPVSFWGRRFDFLPTGPESGIHELASALGTIDGDLSFPGFVLLNTDFELVFQHAGFLSAEELVAVLEAALSSTSMP